MPFAAEAELPAAWECRVCGATAQLVDGGLPEPKRVKITRTHWDMLLERRTLDDLEGVLAERREQPREFLRRMRAAGVHLHHDVVVPLQCPAEGRQVRHSQPGLARAVQREDLRIHGG